MTPTSYDICVIGATPSGIAAAIRGARAGHRVLLTQHTQHIGGMCTNGLGQWDAKSDHRRCPIFREILQRLETHYRDASGEGSADLIAATYSCKQFPIGAYEPSVIEGIFNAMIDAEPTITVALGVYPASATVTDGSIATVTLQALQGDATEVVAARVFIDATYEADLAAAAGVEYHVGREGYDDFHEPHAGRLFTQVLPGDGPSLAVEGVLNLRPFHMHQGPVDPQSPRTGDRCIQAYNTRGCVARDPGKRILPDKPQHYDRERYLGYKRRALHITADINGKNSYNTAILPGENWDYPDGDWATRERITREHHAFAVGLMYFLQNDESIPLDQRQRHREWGLAADEFTDNNHLPYEIYVRETRRIRGRHILTENDFLPREGLMRPRCFADSICFTDWYMDSHSCSPDIGTFGPGEGRVGSPEYPYDGKLILTEEFRPGMVPYRCLVSETIDNLIVSVCVSTTHIAWGSVRLEPIWIHLGEVAGYAAAQALRTGEAANALDVSVLQKTLLADNAAIAFFNQHATATEYPDYADHQLAACHGEYDSYDLGG